MHAHLYTVSMGEWQGQGEGAREELRGRDQGLKMRCVSSLGMFFLIVLTKTKTLCRQMGQNGWGLEMQHVSSPQVCFLLLIKLFLLY